MPTRLLYQKHEWILAPFDGIVTHIGKYDPAKDVFNVKGKSYSINELIEAEISEPCYSIGIFLTAFSVHLGRSPVTGVIRKVEDLPPLLTANMFMDFAEMGLLVDRQVYPERLDFAKKNQRRLIEIRDTQHNLGVIIVSVADRYVDSLLDFKAEDDVVHKGCRLQFVNWGSYAEMVIPVNRPDLKLKPLVKELDYVFAGKTAVFEVRN